LLLGKSLRLSKLWDHAWHALNNGYEHSSKAHGPFLFQIGKLSVQAAQDKLGIHSERVGENPGRVGLVDPLVLERWLSRGHEHLEKFRTHERTKADFRKGRRYRELLEKCKRQLKLPILDPVREQDVYTYQRATLQSKVTSVHV